MTNAISSFRDAILAVGLEPPKFIEPGKMYRFPGIDKNKSNTAGWCKLFDDSSAGCFGDWSSDLNEVWHAQQERNLTLADKEAFQRKIREARESAEAEREALYGEARDRALAILKDSVPAENNHPYLMRKDIEAHGARLYRGSLVLPLASKGVIHSLQFIDSDGTKKFLRGGKITGNYFAIGTIQEAKALCIAEGFATGASIHEATGYPVAVAFNANNLEPVVRSVREKYPALPIIICADDDAESSSNIGLLKAEEAATASQAILAVPNFGDHRPEGLSDFNDMAKLLGLEAVAKAIRFDSTLVNIPNSYHEWESPLPLSSKIEPEPYPLDALPEIVRNAVNEVFAFTKAPLPLVAGCALAAMSLAIQAHVDVKRAEKLLGPTSLFLLTIADSGERKSTCDGFFMQAIKEYESNQSELAMPLLKDFQVNMDIWEAKHNGIKEKIRQKAKAGKSAFDEEAALSNLEHSKPKAPRVPRLVYGDATPEALKWNLAKGWPSGGVVSSEAGSIFGSHGMAKDSVMRNLATLNQLWDGAEIPTERRSSESFTVKGARLTIGLQVQESTLRSFFDRSSGLARGTGFLARFLFAWPESTQGNRLFSEASETWPALSIFNTRITAILNQNAPINESGALSPTLLSLSGETKQAWIRFHDVIEAELNVSGELHDVRDIASKSADNAARMAALFHVFSSGAGTISTEEFEGASRIAMWHLMEARRFYGELPLSQEQIDIVKLDRWLLNYCIRKNVQRISFRDIQRNITPSTLRTKNILLNALNELIELQRVRVTESGKKKEVHINPALLEGAEHDSL